MPHDDVPLATSAMIALAGEVLATNGYRVARDLIGMSRSGQSALLAEDSFSVVSVVAFETWQQLEIDWMDAQADLVDLLAKRLARSAPKAWDGYLVLLCAGEPLDRRDAVQIERDTTRLRKIVATGAALQTTNDVRQVLDLLLPLELPAKATALEDVLDTLPELLSASVPPLAVRVVVDAFRAMEPPLDRLHELGGEG